MLQALIEGQENPVPLADLAQRQLRGKIPELQKALQGYLTEHHRFLAAAAVETTDPAGGPDRGVGRPNRGAPTPLRRGDRALGLHTGRRLARRRGCAGGSGSRHETVSDSSELGRVGRDVSGQRGECGQTPSAAHHPGQSLAETNARTGRLGSQPHQECLFGLPVPSPRRSARQETRSHRPDSILVIGYLLLKSKTSYTDLGGDFFDRLEPQRLTRYYVRRLESLGQRLRLKPAPPHDRNFRSRTAPDFAIS